MKSLNVLCFGDSITAGWSHGGTVYHPYADAMLASLKKSLSFPNITADVQGSPGDQVTTPPGGFLTRMDILCKESAHSSLFDFLDLFVLLDLNINRSML